MNSSTLKEGVNLSFVLAQSIVGQHNFSSFFLNYVVQYDFLQRYYYTENVVAVLQGLC